MKMISIKRNQLELGCYFFLKDLTPVMKKSQKYLPINFSKGTFFAKSGENRFGPF